jgi:hypothetical protein
MTLETNTTADGGNDQGHDAQAAPGWYPTAQGDRYWDGSEWTDHLLTQQAQPVAEKKSHKTAWILTGGAALLGLVAFGAMSPSTTEELAKAGDSLSQSAEVQEPAVEEPVVEEPQLTVAQENAIESAESYLAMSGFSKNGLIDQLEFEGYSTKDATLAVNTVDVDWKAEAAESAESYLDMTSFSRSGLVEQLTFEGFTPAQAEYAADQMGL